MKNRFEVEVAVAVDVEDSFAINRGKWIRAATMWETRPENNPAADRFSIFCFTKKRKLNTDLR